jgi:formyltetrahydrofolate-dependent phosphoribosylglycinamide formyltransferase
MIALLTPASVTGSERVQVLALSSQGERGGERGRDASVQVKNIVVLISGAGSNLQALINAERAGQLGAVRISTVVCNRFKAGGIQLARAANIPVRLFSLAAFCNGDITPEKRRAYDAELAQRLNALNPDLIILAGWMHIFSPAFLNAVIAPVINLHPALAGQFTGAHGIDDAYAAWQAGQITHTGCMVHEVIEQIDAGKVIAMQIVPCLAGDSLSDLKQRMHKAEHALIVRAVREYCEARKNKK